MLDVNTKMEVSRERAGVNYKNNEATLEHPVN